MVCASCCAPNPAPGVSLFGRKAGVLGYVSVKLGPLLLPARARMVLVGRMPLSASLPWPDLPDRDVMGVSTKDCHAAGLVLRGEGFPAVPDCRRGCRLTSRSRDTLLGGGWELASRLFP